MCGIVTVQCHMSPLTLPCSVVSRDPRGQQLRHEQQEKIHSYQNCIGEILIPTNRGGDGSQGARDNQCEYYRSESGEAVESVN